MLESIRGVFVGLEPLNSIVPHSKMFYVQQMVQSFFSWAAGSTTHCRVHRARSRGFRTLSEPFTACQAHMVAREELHQTWFKDNISSLPDDIRVWHMTLVKVRNKIFSSTQFSTIMRNIFLLLHQTILSNKKGGNHSFTLDTWRLFALVPHITSFQLSYLYLTLLQSGLPWRG